MNELTKLSKWIVLFIMIGTVNAAETVINFADGKWDKSHWQIVKCFPIKPVEKLKDFSFSQKQDSISFDCSADDVIRGDDNCLMVYDTENEEAEFEVVFESGKGHPGIFISPDIAADRILQKTYCIFVADYTFAIWRVETDPILKTAKYIHMVRVSKSFPMFQKHKIICRYNKKGFTVKVDDSDTIVLYPENFKVNSKVGIWGCHGLSNYYSMTIKDKKTVAR